MFQSRCKTLQFIINLKPPSPLLDAQLTAALKAQLKFKDVLLQEIRKQKAEPIWKKIRSRENLKKRVKSGQNSPWGVVMTSLWCCSRGFHPGCPMLCDCDQSSGTHLYRWGHFYLSVTALSQAPVHSGHLQQGILKSQPKIAQREWKRKILFVCLFNFFGEKLQMALMINEWSLYSQKYLGLLVSGP